MWDGLPLEIWSKIVGLLDQNSLIAASNTNHKFHALAKPNLYKTIEVNSCKKLLSDDISKVGATRVTTIYNLKTLLKNLVHNKNDCKLIQKFIFKNLPDLPEDYLIGYFMDIFPELANLVEFRWYSSYHLDIQIINLLPRKKLVKLNGNFKNFNNFNNDNFKNLKSLSLAGFQNFDNISIQLNNFKNLKMLKISKKNLVLVEDNLNNLLNYDGVLNLKGLNLENLYLGHDDIQLLKKKVNLEDLQLLKINNCHEVIESGNSLTNLNLKSLKLLEISYNNIQPDNQHIYNFLSRLELLESLRIRLNVRSNLLKNTEILLMNLPLSLQSLELSFKIPNNAVNILQNNSQRTVLELLNNFKRLAVLKFPVFSTSLDWLHLHLPHLYHLELHVLDTIRFKNSLINIDRSSLTLTAFNGILSSLECPRLETLVVKLFDYHIYNVKNKVVNSLPELVS